MGARSRAHLTRFTVRHALGTWRGWPGPHPTQAAWHPWVSPSFFAPCECHPGVAVAPKTGLLFSRQKAWELPWGRTGPGPGHCALALGTMSLPYLFEVTLVFGKGKFHCVIV